MAVCSCLPEDPSVTTSLISPYADGRPRGEPVSSDPSTEPEPQPRGGTDWLDVPDERIAPIAGSESRVSQSVESSVSITLSRNQVDHVMRGVLGDEAGPSMSTLVAGAGFHSPHTRRVLGARYRSLRDNRRLSRSLLSGLLVLSCFPPKGADLGIKDISKELDLNTSTVHRYVLTLVAAGLLERDPDTRRYRLLAE